MGQVMRADPAWMVVGPANIRSWTPDDDADLPKTTNAVWVGGSAAVTIAVENLDGTTSDLPDLTPGMWHALRVKRIRATGTDGGLSIRIGVWG